MRSINNAFITFPPFISAPVKTFTASASHSEAFNFHHVHDDGTPHRITRPYICSECGGSVAYTELVKGQTRNGVVLLTTEDELAKIETDAGKDYEVLRFVHADSVPVMLYGDPYLLEPDEKRGKQATETYLTLLAVLRETRLLGIVKYCTRGKTHLAALGPHPQADVLVLQNLLWPDELRDVTEVNVKSVKLNEKAVKLMTELVQSMQNEFDDPDNPYVDKYSEGVKALLDAKEKGAPLPEPSEADAVEDVGDLLAKLQQSIKARTTTT